MKRHKSPQRKSKLPTDSKRHFMRRIRERYGFDLTDAEYDALCRDVREQRARFEWKESNTRTHYTLTVRGTEVSAVYDKRLSALVTALPQREAAA